MKNGHVALDLPHHGRGKRDAGTAVREQVSRNTDDDFDEDRQPSDGDGCI
jgi:hypothetical protein